MGWFESGCVPVLNELWDSLDSLRCVRPGLVELHTEHVPPSACRCLEGTPLQILEPSLSGASSFLVFRLTCTCRGSFPKLQPPPSYLCGTCSLRSGPRAGGQGSGLTHLFLYPQRWPSLLLVFLSLRTVLSCVLSSFLVVYVRQESKLRGSHSLRARSRSLCNAFRKVKRIKLVLPRKSERRIQGEDPFPMW